MLFTAIQVPRGKASSVDFVDHGAEGLAPAPVSDARILGVPKDEDALKRAAQWILLPSFIAATNSIPDKRCTDILFHTDNSFRKSDPDGITIGIFVQLITVGSNDLDLEVMSRETLALSEVN